MANGDDFATQFAGLGAEPDAAPGLQTVENPNPQQQTEIANEWLDWLEDPGVQSGLLQFGLQALQPTPVGQTTGGALAQAVGAGFEAADRVKISDIAATEREQRAGLEERKVAAAERTAAKPRAGERVKGQEILALQKSGLLQKVAAGTATAEEKRAARLAFKDTDPLRAFTEGVLFGDTETAAAPSGARKQAPARKQTAAPQEGQTFTNPTTKERLIVRNGKLVPL